MCPDEAVQFDDTGKAEFGDAYAGGDPRGYFTTLGRHDYRIPGLAKPYFANLIAAWRAAHQERLPRVLDLGCSYGINAALLGCDLSLDELYARYTGADAAAWSRQQLLDRDRALVAARADRRCAHFVGLDPSGPALSYALAAGLLDDAVCADLEEQDPTPAHRGTLADTDVVISTGCIGYVTEKTVARIVDCYGGRKPWMAHFVLRMFPFDEVAAALTERGYRIRTHDGVFQQRRFASAQEQEQVLDTLRSVGVDPTGLEVDGWLYARLYLCRPPDADPAEVDLRGGDLGDSSAPRWAR